MKNLNKKGLLGYILGIVLLCLIDQLTKIAAVSALKGKSPFVLIKNVLEFYYLENAGMAWGMMSGARIYFLVLTVLIVGGSESLTGGSADTVQASIGAIQL